MCFWNSCLSSLYEDDTNSPIGVSQTTQKAQALPLYSSPGTCWYNLHQSWSEEEEKQLAFDGTGP